MTTGRIFFTFLIFSTFLSLALMLDGWQPLRGDYGWRWPHEVPERLDQWLPSLVGLLVYVGGGIILLKRSKRGLILLWSYLGCVILPFIFLARWGDPLFHQFTRVASGGTSGPHRIALEYDEVNLEDRLKNWTSEQGRFAEDHISIHAALAPPGLPLIYYETAQLLEHVGFLADPLADELRPLQCNNLELAANSNAEISSALVGMLSPFWAGLAIFPLFGFAKRLSQDEFMAQGVVLLWALVVGIAVFTPVPNTVFPLFSLLVVVFLWEALEKRALGWAFGSGLTMSVLTFLNISLVPLILLCGLLALGYHLFIAHYQTPRPVWYWSLQIGVAFGLGLASLWGAWMLWGGEAPWAILQTAMNQHLELERPYLPWLVLHIWDFGLFLGLPILFLGLWAMVLAMQQVYQTRRLSELNLVALSLGLTLLLVNVSGMARGETGRVWQFFFPFHLTSILCIIKLNPKISATSRNTVWLSFLLVSQGFATFVIAVYLNVIGTGLEVPPQVPPEMDTPQIQVETQARFGDSLFLTGFGGQLEGTDLLLDLRWQTSAWQESPYYVAILPITPDGTPFEESFVYQPFDAVYPITCWQPNQIIIERSRIPLGDNALVGDWWFSLSVHDYTTYQPLTTQLPDGTNDDQVGIGAIRLE